MVSQIPTVNTPATTLPTMVAGDLKKGDTCHLLVVISRLNQIKLSIIAWIVSIKKW